MRVIQRRPSVRESQQFYRNFGNRCRELRKERGLTQEQMADLGFSTRFYQRIEAGKPIHFNTVLKLKNAFAVTLSQLFKGFP